MPKIKPKKKTTMVAIIFEDDGSDHFKVYCNGLDPERIDKLPEDEWSPAEYWGVVVFQRVIAMLEGSGMTMKKSARGLSQ